DQLAADIRAQNIGRTLRPEQRKGVSLAVGLNRIESLRLEVLVHQHLPELIHVQDEAAAVDQLLHTVEQVHHRNGAGFRILQKVCDIKSKVPPRGELDGVRRIIEKPAQRPSRTPFTE